MNDTSKERVAVEFNLFALKKKLELQQGREYSWAEMAASAGLHHNTVSRIGTNKTDRVDLATLARLLGFFRNEGMPVEIQDLFKVASTESE